LADRYYRQGDYGRTQGGSTRPQGGNRRPQNTNRRPVRRNDFSDPFDDDFMEPRRQRGQGRRARRRRKILQTVIPAAIAIVLIAVIVLVAVKTGLFDSFTYSSKKADLNSYFACMSMDTATVIKDGEMTEERITVKNGHLYQSLNTVLEKYNDEFYWEEASGRLLYTTGDGIYSTNLDSNSYSLNGNTNSLDYTVAYKNGDEVMLCLDYVRLFTNFEYNLCGGDSQPYRVEIKTSWGSDTVADINDETAIRIEADKQADILKEVKKGDVLVIDSSENENWMKVTTDDLITGFVEKKYLDDSYERPQTPVTDAITINVNKVADYSKPVVLAWHNVTNTDSASYLDDYSKYLGCFNTISPTWFSLSDDEGTVASIASESYVTMCHNQGIKVWGLVDNMTYPEVSSYTVLSDPDKRAKVIEQLLSYSVQYNLDGINVDFEMLTEDAGPGFVQFIRELCLEAHKQNLVVSVDNYVPQGYTLHYNRYEQGLFADYVIIMGYDEHTSGSSEAGSVASIDFVLKGIEQTLEEVPANEVINALPFYSRLWTVADSGEIMDLQTLPMATAVETVSKAGATASWDEVTNQNYAQWSVKGGTNKIWLEDKDSLKSKLDVMKAQNVGGVAVWQLAYSTSSAWEVINEYYTK